MRAATIKVKVVCARNLIGKDRSGTSDPYVTVKLGDQQQKTHVVPRTLNPVWNVEMLFRSSFHVWDKDLIGRDFLGEYTIPVATLVNYASDYDDPKNSSAWYILNPRKSDEVVRGDISFRVGIVGDIDRDLKEMFRQYVPKSWDHATLVSSDDPADDLYFNNFTNVVRQTADPSATVSDVSPTSVTTMDPRDLLEKVALDHSELVGMLTLEIVGARDLPLEPSRSRSFNCDPFAVVSFGKRTFRTKVVRQSLDPDWGQRAFLHVKSIERKANWNINVTVFDHEDFSSSEAIGFAEIPIQDLIVAAGHLPKASFPRSEPLLQDLSLPLKTKKQLLHGAPTPRFLIRFGFVPYTTLRCNFFLGLIESFTKPDSSTINKPTLTTLLDSIGSTYSDETIDGLFFDMGKTPDDDMTFDEAVMQLESRLHVDAEDNSHTTAAPHQAVQSSAGAGFDAGQPPRHSWAYRPSPFRTPKGVRPGERMIEIKQCPICLKEIRQTQDLDIVSHVALCSHMDAAKVDHFVLGGLLTPAHASRMWYTKILSYVSSEHGRGKGLNTILYQDRATGQLCEERIPIYIRLGIRLLYQYKGSQALQETDAIRNLLHDMSIRQGRKFDDPSSKSQITSFVAFHNLDLDEVLNPMDSYKNFNEFFARKLKPTARTLASLDPQVVVCPADGRVMVFKSIQAATQLWIKGSEFSVANLLSDASQAQRFNHGSLAIFRLAPQDYHRVHFPVDGLTLDTRLIHGSYFTTSPMAVQSAIDVYTENVRTVTYMDSAHFGRVAIVCIGAMLVGSVVITSRPGQIVQRMDEHGYYKFGGSTVVLVFEKNAIEFDRDLSTNSDQGLETLVKMGNSLGVKSAL
ncbi:phosphatidylserine decarboxylase-domain-containing protein [Entophlyctis helioformis]|nr:phosphatidylserine decarboxylase-domain-containing protein [Entophlyctis helioformis]